MKKFCFVALCLLFVAATANADPFFIGTYEQVLAGTANGSCGRNCVTIDDKEFFDIFLGGGFSPAGENIFGEVVGTTDIISFSVPYVVPAGATSADFSITYRVRTTGGATIDAIDQLVVGNIGTEGGSFSVTERVFDAPFPDTTTQFAVSSLSTTPADFFDPPAELNDQLIISPGQTSLYIAKDISLFGAGTEVTTIRQSFHQTPIPEPATASLLGLGLAGLWFLSRRKRS